MLIQETVLPPGQEEAMIDEKIEASPNHCLCTTSHLKHLYETALGRPVDVELIETCLRGGDSCTIRISW
jgi:hypothetical protein